MDDRYPLYPSAVHAVRLLVPEGGTGTLSPMGFSQLLEEDPPGLELVFGDGVRFDGRTLQMDPYATEPLVRNVPVAQSVEPPCKPASS